MIEIPESAIISRQAARSAYRQENSRSDTCNQSAQVYLV